MIRRKDRRKCLSLFPLLAEDYLACNPEEGGRLANPRGKENCRFKLCGVSSSFSCPEAGTTEKRRCNEALAF